MSHDLKKNVRIGVQSGMDALVGMIRDIENISGKKVDLTSTDNLADPKQLRAEETAIASKELLERQRQLRENFIKRTRESGHIDPAWTFKALQRDPANQKAIGDAEIFCQAHFARPDLPPTLMIVTGLGGTGKTVLANAIANLWLDESGKDVCILTPSQLEKTRFFSSNEEWSETRRRHLEWKRYTDADLLIIDGLCENGQGLSSFMQKVLPELLRSRREKNLSMVITANLPGMNFLSRAVGQHCYESFKEYSVVLGQLMGNSRRKPITMNGMVLE